MTQFANKSFSVAMPGTDWHSQIDWTNGAAPRVVDTGGPGGLTVEGAPPAGPIVDFLAKGACAVCEDKITDLCVRGEHWKLIAAWGPDGSLRCGASNKEAGQCCHAMKPTGRPHDGRHFNPIVYGGGLSWT